MIERENTRRKEGGRDPVGLRILETDAVLIFLKRKLGKKANESRLIWKMDGDGVCGGYVHGRYGN